MKTPEKTNGTIATAKRVKPAAGAPKRVTKKVGAAKSLFEKPSVPQLESESVAELSLEAAIVQEYTSDVDRIRARHTLRLEQIYRKAIAGHTQSCEDERTEKRTAQGDGAGSSDGAAASTAKRADASKYKVESTRKGRAGTFGI